MFRSTDNTSPEKKASSIEFIFKEKVNYKKIWQHICGIVPTFLSLEAHQGTIISYVTAI